MLRTYPLDLAAPEWVDDPAFDITHHVRRAAIPPPGDDAALFREVANLMERRLDRQRPLWECWVIEGLAEDRWAILVKVHHCIADGIAATHFLAALCDDSDVSSFATNIRAAKAQPRRGLPAAPSLNPVNWAKATLRLSAGTAKAAVRTATGALEVAVGILRPTGNSTLTGPVTCMLRGLNRMRSPKVASSESQAGMGPHLRCDNQ